MQDRNDLERRQHETEATLGNHTELLREISSKQDAHTKKLQELGHALILQRTDILLLQNNVTTLQEDMEAVKGDVNLLKQNVESLERKMDNGFQAMEKRFDAIAEVQKLILERLPEKE